MLKGGGRGPGGDLLFRRLSGSTIGAEGFHGRVRDGIGCLAPRYGHQACPRNAPAAVLAKGKRAGGLSGGLCHVSGQCLRGAAACLWAPADGGDSARLAPGRVLPLHAGGVRRHQAPVERLVPVSCAGCPASTSGLSTWWSSTALERDLVLRRVSRLDAFSGYPVRT